jgi:inorganic triphosphatase YgiF
MTIASRSTMAEEIEMKFELAPDALSKLEATPWFQRLERSAEREELVSVYFDTPKFELRDGRFSLRVRHEGDKRSQTIKTEAIGPFSRREWETAIEDDSPDLERARQTALKPLATSKLWKKLEPVFETEVQRTTIPLEANGSRIEMAIDRGFVRSGGRAQPINEIELELRSGTTEALVELARTLAEVAPVRYAVRSKAERGYALAAKEPTRAVRAEPIELPEGVATGEAIQIIVLSCLRQLVLNEDGVRSRDPEAIHQMRVALRRLRAALSLFKSVLEDPETDELKGELKSLTDQLGPARDYDVFVDELVSPAEQATPADADLEELGAVIRERRAEGFEDAARAVDNERTRQTILATALWIVQGRWTTTTDPLRRAQRARPAAAFARDVFAERTKKAKKKLRKLRSLDAARRHKLRIAVKKLHYATEFYRTSFPEAETERMAYERTLKKVQDCLGRLNDVVVHERLASAIKKGSPTRSGRVPGAPAAFAMGRLTARESEGVESLVEAATDAGARLRKTPRFWKT